MEYNKRAEALALTFLKRRSCMRTKTRIVLRVYGDYDEAALVIVDIDLLQAASILASRERSKDLHERA